LTPIDKLSKPAPTPLGLYKLEGFTIKTQISSTLHNSNQLQGRSDRQAFCFRQLCCH
jgi:hypothetical protein